MDEQAQAEAWVRKKPRRIIQNQTLIQLLIILSIATPIPLAGVAFWMVFAVCPFIAIPSILASWACATVTYVALWFYGQRQNKKS